jgi:hypothetical protein
MVANLFLAVRPELAGRRRVAFPSLRVEAKKKFMPIGYQFFALAFSARAWATIALTSLMSVGTW